MILAMMASCNHSGKNETGEQSSLQKAIIDEQLTGIEKDAFASPEKLKPGFRKVQKFVAEVNEITRQEWNEENIETARNKFNQSVAELCRDENRFIITKAEKLSAKVQASSLKRDLGELESWVISEYWNFHRSFIVGLDTIVPVIIKNADNSYIVVPSAFEKKYPPEVYLDTDPVNPLLVPFTNGRAMITPAMLQKNNGNKGMICFRTLNDARYNVPFEIKK